MRLIQFSSDTGTRVAICDGDDVWALRNFHTTYELAQHAIESGQSMQASAVRSMVSEALSYRELETTGRILAPVSHPVPSSFLVSGTGLTHLGSALARDTMHRVQHVNNGEPSDSMKMFQMGLIGGKPPDPQSIGVQPEWFYKGTGECVVGSGADMSVPAFCGSGAEEPEIVGIYVIDRQGQPRRLGFTLGNDLSDHVTEQTNYLYLAHSKLLPCSLGPELLLDELPSNIVGTSSIVRNGKQVWQQEFLSGEANMCHSLSNLEHHHFKYARHRVPGSLHAHFLGCPVMSYNDGFSAQPGDIFEFAVPAFGHPLRNQMVTESAMDRVHVGSL